MRITIGGTLVVIDDGFYSTYMKYKWFLIKQNLSIVAQVDGKTVYLHRMITGCPENLVVDHINHDRLDNRLINLRVCSRSDNQRNRYASRNNRTGYKGVFHSTGQGERPYEARIQYNGKKKYLGRFNSAYSAAMAYNIAARSYYGNFAMLN